MRTSTADAKRSSVSSVRSSVMSSTTEVMSSAEQWRARHGQLDRDVVAAYQLLVRVLRVVAIVPRAARKGTRARKGTGGGEVRVWPALVLALFVGNAVLRYVVWTSLRPQPPSIVAVMLLLDIAAVLQYCALLYLFRTANRTHFRRLALKVARLPDLGEGAQMETCSLKRSFRRMLALYGTFISGWALAMLGIVYIYQSSLHPVAILFYATRILDVSLVVAVWLSPWIVSLYLRLHTLYALRLAHSIEQRRVEMPMKRLTRRIASNHLQSVTSDTSDLSLSPRSVTSSGTWTEKKPTRTNISGQQSFQQWVLQSKQVMRGHIHRAYTETGLVLNTALLCNAAIAVEGAVAIYALFFSSTALKEVISVAGAILWLGVLFSIRPMVNGLLAMRSARRRFADEFSNVMQAVDDDEDDVDQPHDGFQLDGNTRNDVELTGRVMTDSV